MKNVGLRHYRLKDNPLEKKFAEAWELENERGDLLDHLMDIREMQGGSPPEAAEIPRTVAATVIQWLGSPVGQGFLSNLGFTFSEHAVKVGLKTGDVISDNDPRRGGTRRLTVRTFDNSYAICSDSIGREHRVLLRRIYTDGKKRRMGFSLILSHTEKNT